MRTAHASRTSSCARSCAGERARRAGAADDIEHLQQRRGRELHRAVRADVRGTAEELQLDHDDRSHVRVALLLLCQQARFAVVLQRDVVPPQRVARSSPACSACSSRRASVARRPGAGARERRGSFRNSTRRSRRSSASATSQAAAPATRRSR